MPELPEVQSTINILQPRLVNQTIRGLTVRTAKLRLPLDQKLSHVLVGLKIQSVTRRAKYLLINTLLGSIVIHLGMSGSLRIVNLHEPAQKHDYVDLEFENSILRFTDPRKFGAFLWLKNHALAGHKLFVNLGLEPLTDEFNAQALFLVTRNRKMPIKQFLMQNQFVVGIGNIYASESLFMAKINPTLAAGKISLRQCQELVKQIKIVLHQAIELGGSTLKDFIKPDGKPGYFANNHQVYGRTGKPCLKCDTTIEKLVLAGRSTFFCPKCQPK